MSHDEVRNVCVAPTTTLSEAMKRIDHTGTGIVFVVDESRELLGTATDGDIRRGILDGLGLETAVDAVMNDDPVVVRQRRIDDGETSPANAQKVRDRTKRYETLIVPVVDGDGRVVDLTHVSRDGTVKASSELPNQSVQTVLIIGGAGYIGSVLARKLLEQGYRVRVLDKLIFGRQGVADLQTNDRFTLIEGDMRSIETVTQAIKGVDAVVHLGALVGDPASSIDPQKTLEVNYHAVKLAASICKYHQVNRFLFASTCSVYGRSESPTDLLTETDELNPVSLYAKTKIESERALLEKADQNFAPTIFRMATIYGLSPRMRFDLVVNVLTAKAHEENTVPIFGGDQFRPNVHVADAAQAYVDCLEAPLSDVSGEVFNVGSNEQNYRIEEVGRIVSSCFPDASVDLQRGKEDERSYQVGFDKIRDVLDYEVSHTIEDGCREIKAALEAGRVTDYTDSKYNNYETLESKLSAVADD